MVIRRIPRLRNLGVRQQFWESGCPDSHLFYTLLMTLLSYIHVASLTTKVNPKTDSSLGFGSKPLFEVFKTRKITFVEIPNTLVLTVITVYTVPENVLSANRNNKLLFPTPVGQKNKKQKSKLSLITNIDSFHVNSKSIRLIRNKSQLSPTLLLMAKNCIDGRQNNLMLLST